MENAPTTKKRRPGKINTLLLIAVLILTTACGYLYMRYQHVAKQKGKTTAEQTTALTTKLGTSIALPTETPGLATVLDRSKLGDPQLASEARNGDTLLIYSKARRVVLYRPSSGKVIDMFHLEAAQANSAQAVEPQTAGAATPPKP